ncbi:PhzF family phenazine biosynthesis protein [Janthinobacterium agaricidamnosum]|uniref:Phenazine biosynthesis-like family protein n=1 Tax=Janthinobacterium agaricidamnosum NBRC 102515 = DSM 9628 TaxID=1349767 RepID=W0UZJ2_9BURK|nr:PhzF family phenazine biosynthesis protein [Janthinobacterium agaricidamnosum]CDG81989.1 phenazine biosynthesis-like family protein [Janthinobacterium agaricidamnosum NBRC 102515 = DSM 9628]
MSTLHELKCFGAHPGAGNVAIVIEDDAGDATARQLFAREQNKSACVFIDQSAGGGIVLDYYYPHMRSPLCLHATLAASEVLFARHAGQHSLTVTTAVRGQSLTLLKTTEGYFVSLEKQAAPAVKIDAGLPAALLNQHQHPHLLSAPVIASVGSPKLLLEVKDRAALHALRPNLELIADWGRKVGVSGCYAYYKLADGQYEGRNFNHLDAALEDSATGVAAGALTVHLQQGLSVFQGHATGQDCLIRTQMDGDRILVGGAVEKTV